MAPKGKGKSNKPEAKKPKIVTNFDLAETYFSNRVGLTTTEEGEMRLDFAIETRFENVHSREVFASIYLTLVTAKKMAGLMLGQITEYEEVFGELPLEPKKKK